MEDYQEYKRIAKMMTKIHAKPQILPTTDDDDDCVENNGEYSNDSNENKEYTDDEVFAAKQNYNMDVSMEEDKEPLQSLNCNYSRITVENRKIGGPCYEKSQSKYYQLI